jgi:hypothetical protein
VLVVPQQSHQTGVSSPLEFRQEDVEEGHDEVQHPHLQHQGQGMEAEGASSF